MNRKALILIIVLLGVLLAVYGVTKAPLSNEREIRSNYRCDRITKETLSTDKYCFNPSSAPEAKKQFANPYVYAGFALALVGGAYFVISHKRQNR